MFRKYLKAISMLNTTRSSQSVVEKIRSIIIASIDETPKAVTPGRP